MEHYTYWFILWGSLAFPLAFSFEKRICFYKTWKYLFPAIAITALFFIVWDHYFTIRNVWSFNEKYITGFKIFGLPIEEILFFIIIPYCCTFIYEALRIFLRRELLKNYEKLVNRVLLLSLIILAVFNVNKAYTFFTCFFTSIYLILLMIYGYDKMSRFYPAYLLSKIPFLIVNGILTALPVVIYNDNENLGLRAFTIPLDDFIYSFLMLLMTISLMEIFRSRKIKNQMESR